MNKTKFVAIVIGHSTKSKGACNEDQKLYEYDFNNNLAQMIQHGLSQSNIDVALVYRGTYKRLPNDVNKINPDFIVSLHCNAYNKKVSGTETLYYHRSTRGKQLASIVQKELVNVLGLKNRGIKPKDSEDRGGYLLKNTKAPCVITEPFFIDNNEDLKAAQDNITDLAKAYCLAISEFAEI